MTFLEAITWDYLLVVGISFLMSASVVYYRLFISTGYSNPNDDNDDDGGFDRDPKDPILDLPDGVTTLDEWEKERSKDKELTGA